MLRHTPLQAWLLTLVCVALLFARVGDAHLHLCFDGSEPPASLHFTDAGHHADHHVGEVHDDLDLSLIDDVLSQMAKLGLGLLMLLLAAFWLSFLLFVPARIVPADPPRVTATPPCSLRPPLRGPPPHKV